MDDKDEDKDEYSAEWWQKEIGQTQKTIDERWGTSAAKVVDRYLDRRHDTQESTHSAQFRYNIFWANVGILKAALYANPPKPMVTRQNEDADDDIARVSANILERLLQNDFTKDKSEVHTALRQAVEDRLVPGLGQIWMIYEPKIGLGQIPAVNDPTTGAEISPGSQYKKIVSQKVCTEYVNWRDFLWSPARTWEEVWWVARRIWMRKDRLIKRWGNEKYLQINESEYRASSVDDKLPKNFKRKKFELFEIWCKVTNKVYIICRDILLEQKDDPLELEEFFPCPAALIATHTTNEWMPRSDYVMLQDQYDELDELTSRVYLLEKAIRVVGAYDNTCSELKTMLATARENEMIGVTNWGNLVEKGGLKGVVDWFPLEVLAATLDKLRQQKMDKIQEIYELTGISDIMRGATAPRETARAQELKAQYSSVRLQYAEQEVALFVRDTLRLKAEIICGHFTPEVIKQQSGIMSTPDANLADQAIQLLKSADLAEYRIEVSEESLALPDYNQERDTRVEYLTTLGQFISQVAPMAQALPGSQPYLMKMVQWVTAGFRGSKEMEGVLDQAFQEVQKATENPPPPQPSPEEIKGKNQMQVETLKGQIQQQLKQLEAQTNAAIEQNKAQKDVTVEQMKADHSLELEKLRGTVQIIVAQIQAGQDQAAGQMTIDHERWENAQDRLHEQTMQVRDLQHEAGQSSLDRASDSASQASEQASEASTAASQGQEKDAQITQMRQQMEQMQKTIQQLMQHIQPPTGGGNGAAAPPVQ